MKGIFHNNFFLFTLFKHYYSITKPGIIYGNAITVIAGYIYASHGSVDYVLLLYTLIGIACVIASGCVFNNYIDRDIDALMERTKKRVLIQGGISARSALIYASLLGILGLYVLYCYTSTITCCVAMLGLFVYVVIYSLWLKRTSVHAALIGSISGAVPILVGYTAVAGRIDMEGVLLFCILALWQMPHSYAIAIYRLSDYKAASLPVLPIVFGVRRTKVEMVVYACLFLIALALLGVYGSSGYFYMIAMGVLGMFWISICMYGLVGPSDTDTVWARKVFLFSLIILITFCVAIAV